MNTHITTSSLLVEIAIFHIAFFSDSDMTSALANRVKDMYKIVANLDLFCRFFFCFFFCGSKFDVNHFAAIDSNTKDFGI